MEQNYTTNRIQHKSSTCVCISKVSLKKDSYLEVDGGGQDAGLAGAGLGEESVDLIEGLLDLLLETGSIEVGNDRDLSREVHSSVVDDDLGHTRVLSAHAGDVVLGRHGYVCGVGERS